MKIVTLNLPETLVIGGPAGRDATMATAAWSEEFLLNMALHGMKQRRTDKYSVIKSEYKEDTDKGIGKAIEALAELDKSFIEGEIPSGGGGGGPRLSVEDAGMIAFFNSKGSPIKFAKQTANGKNLDQYIKAFVQKAIWPSVSKAIASLDKQAQIAFHKEKMPELVKANTDKVLEIALADSSGIGGFIEAERMKRDGKKPESFQVEIEIQL